jgi:DNA-binding response OmpR family regulator
MSTTILIVDDDADIRDMMKLFLETDGYQVIAAADGQDALQQVQRVRPGVIVLDLTMPDMDGEEFLERMRATRFARTPVVIMSGRDSSRDKAQELRAAGCVNKPVDLDELLKTIRQIVSAS